MSQKMNDLTVILLAGGKSSRMGKDKALLDWRGKPLIQALVESWQPVVSQVIVVTKDKEKFGFLGTTVVSDRFPCFSPLAGMATGLFSSRTEFNFVLACDMPRVNMELVSRLYASVEDFDGVVPESSLSLEPLCALYRRRCLGAFEACIEKGVLSVKEALRGLRVKVISCEEATLHPSTVFLNMNTQTEYESVLR